MLYARSLNSPATMIINLIIKTLVCSTLLAILLLPPIYTRVQGCKSCNKHLVNGIIPNPVIAQVFSNCVFRHTGVFASRYIRVSRNAVAALSIRDSGTDQPFRAHLSHTSHAWLS
ncbi:unnamed protein product [Mycena citricolor]|uniref:Uncharacterized protein n=1 Tax=Mycena citricolor TaxID=2018698 RepID=A0AAD2Q0P0_9AGAR|nr:unnamed protein product [Mycena citricolor]CAK5263215.1 unnamed protein product [Mycena citricolor]